MRRDQLEHAIRAACDVASDTELLIFGSQAILGEYPDAPPDLRASVEVDVQPRNNPEAVDLIDGALGELSPFHNLYGFYVQGISISAATLPVGWEERTIRIQNRNTRGNTGFCLESHDIAASKLKAFRDKDRDFVRTLLVEKLINADILRERIKSLPVPSDEKQRLVTWIDKTEKDIF